jgi:hypothetical protein
MNEIAIIETTATLLHLYFLGLKFSGHGYTSINNMVSLIKKNDRTILLNDISQYITPNNKAIEKSMKVNRVECFRYGRKSLYKWK